MRADDRMKRWYENAVIYQIPVAVFQDSTGNGWGDLPGVTERLQHVADLGAEASWLQPFYRGPCVDGGYDVSDHLGVSDRFGTLEDFKDLMTRAHDLPVEVELPVEHRNDWVEAVAGHAYEHRPTGERLHLHGYGYRWLTAAAHSGTVS